MKADIHPAYYENLKITCACGNIIIAGSTKKELKTELCSACHPFYTGKQKLIDTAGRVDKFLEKVKKMQAMKAKKVASADVIDMEQTFEAETVEFEEKKPVKEMAPAVVKSKKVAVKKPKKAAVKVKKTVTKAKAKMTKVKTVTAKTKKTVGSGTKKSPSAKKLSKSKTIKATKK